MPSMSSCPLIDPAVLPHSELVSLVERLLAENAELKRLVGELRDENAHLKGLKGPPQLKPSGMEQATEPKPTPRAGKRRRPTGGKTARLTIHEDQVLKATVPAGSRFKGYESFVVQDLVLRPHVIRFHRERWVTPDGVTVVAPLPPDVRRHFGAQLKRYLLVQYHHGQVTSPRLLTQLHDLGLQISKRQLVRLLNTGLEAFAGRKERLAGSRPDHRAVDHRGRYRCAPSRSERRDDPHRQRSVCLVCHHGVEEPAQFPGAAARRPSGLPRE